MKCKNIVVAAKSVVSKEENRMICESNRETGEIGESDCRAFTNSGGVSLVTIAVATIDRKGSRYTVACINYRTLVARSHLVCV